MDQMRRSDRQMSEDQALKLLAEGEYGILTTIGEDGFPYGVPISYAYSAGHLYFHSATEGKKLRNIAFNPKIQFVVVGETEVLDSKFSTNFESVMAFGTAEEITEPEAKIKALMLLVEKYSPGFEASGEAYAKGSGHKTRVIRMKIEHVTGKERH